MKRRYLRALAAPAILIAVGLLAWLAYVRYSEPRGFIWSAADGAVTMCSWNGLKPHTTLTVTDDYRSNEDLSWELTKPRPWYMFISNTKPPNPDSRFRNIRGVLPDSRVRGLVELYYADGRFFQQIVPGTIGWKCINEPAAKAAIETILAEQDLPWLEVVYEQCVYQLGKESSPRSTAPEDQDSSVDGG